MTKRCVITENVNVETNSKTKVQKGSKMSKMILKTVLSSNGDTTYDIRLGKDGVTYCTCPAWKFSKPKNGVRKCKHLVSFGQEMHDRVASTATADKARS